MEKPTARSKTRSHTQKSASQTEARPVFKFSKNRLETFSDGVIAIIITIMVLNIPLPDKFDLPDIWGLLQSIFIFFVSFFIVGSHWNNHHMLLENVEEISNKLIWRNLLFLFFLSLIPIFAKWVMQNPAEVVPAVGYDIVFILVSVSYQLIWNSAGGDKRIREFTELQGNRTNFMIRRWAIMIITLIVIITLTIFYPRFSLIVFIGFPVVFSLLNLVYEREPRNPALTRESPKK